MVEIELKFQVPRTRSAALRRALATATARRVALRARYFDTDTRALACAGLALRVRREGRAWVQALKGGGDGIWQRVEHEVEVAAPARAAPPADPALFDGTPAGEMLREVLAGAVLQPTYATQVTRLKRTVRTPGCVAELALDNGALLADGRRWPLNELEFELERGDPAALATLAARWVQRFDLVIDVRSKAERGDLLVRALSFGEAARAASLALEPGLEAAQALRRIVAACLQQVLANASVMAHGPYADEHLHQLRVGLRRLRSALRELGDAAPDAGTRWNEPLAQLFARLGESRDRDALARTLLPAIEHAGAGPLLLPARPDDDPVAPLRAPATTLLWLELIAFAAGHASPSAPFEPMLRERLARLFKQVRRDARRFAEFDDPARHRLRKRLKRLRYLLEFGAGLYAPKAVRKLLKAFGPVQDALGHYNDVCVARALFERSTAGDGAAMFARGWLARERDAALQACLDVLPRLRRARACWD